MTKCPKCGYDNQENYIFCMQCGHKMRSTSENEATVLTSTESRSDKVYPESDVPKTRAVESLNQLDDIPGDSSGAKTKIFKPNETRINPQIVEMKDDLSQGNIHDITRITTYLGRKEGEIVYPADTYLSPKHCVFTYNDGKLFVEDLSSFNGVFIKIKDKTLLSDGAYILIGQQLLQFFPFNYKDLLIPEKPETEDILNFYGVSNKKIIALIKQIFSDRSEGNRYFVSSDTVSIGRQAGDILFPEDKFISNRHAVIIYESDNFYLIDNGSSNGVFLQIKGRMEIKDGDYLLIGKQLFEYRAPTT
jgi:pSer/pThr/pTyr-binding forkhead associated (FHA) protein